MRQNLKVATIILAILASALFLFASLPSPSEEVEAVVEDKAEVLRGHNLGVTDLAFSIKGDYIASSGLDNTVRLWDASTGKAVRILRSQSGEVFSVKISRDGQWIVSGGYDSKVVVYDTSGKTVHKLSGFKGWPLAIALSPVSNQIAIWSTEGGIWICELKSGKHIHTLDNEKWGGALAWSPDGRYLAAGRDRIKFWDVKTWQQIKTLNGHKEFITSLVFSPDGRLLASSSKDKTASLWNVNTGELAHMLQPKGFVHFIPTGPVIVPIKTPLTSVAFSPDGKWLVTGGADRVVRLWETSSGKLIRKLIGHTMTVTAAMFSPDGHCVASSSLDGTIRLWQIE